MKGDVILAIITMLLLIQDGGVHAEYNDFTFGWREDLAANRSWQSPIQNKMNGITGVFSV